MPITRGLSLYLNAIDFKHQKNFYYEYYFVYHSPSPSHGVQHHIDLLVWLFKITIKPASVIAFIVSSNICIDVFSYRFGFALMSYQLIMLFLQNIYKEKVNLMQLKSNYFLICWHKLYNFLYYSPLTQCLSAWPPDQFPPANLTLRPVASTIFIPEVESGNLILYTLNNGDQDIKSFCNSEYLTIYVQFE